LTLLFPSRFKTPPIRSLNSSFFFFFSPPGSQPHSSIGTLFSTCLAFDPAYTDLGSPSPVFRPCRPHVVPFPCRLTTSHKFPQIVAPVPIAGQEPGFGTSFFQPCQTPTPRPSYSNGHPFFAQTKRIPLFFFSQKSPGSLPPLLHDDCPRPGFLPPLISTQGASPDSRATGDFHRSSKLYHLPLVTFSGSTGLPPSYFCRSSVAPFSTRISFPRSTLSFPLLNIPELGSHIFFLS